jgi:hypothetical protein
MLRILGLLFLALIAAVAILFGLTYRHDQSARTYVSAAVPAIYNNWDFAKLKERASVQLRKDPGFDSAGPQMFRMMGEALGPLESATAPEGKAGYGWGESAPARGIYGDYQVHAKFRAGEAELRLFVVKEDGMWRIAAFNVNSPVLIDPIRRQQRPPPDSSAN